MGPRGELGVPVSAQNMIRLSSQASWGTSAGFTSRQSHSGANAKYGVSDIELPGLLLCRQSTNLANERGDKNTNSSTDLISSSLVLWCSGATIDVTWTRAP